jgi:hypothetical protein
MASAQGEYILPIVPNFFAKNECVKVGEYIIKRKIGGE